MAKAKAKTASKANTAAAESASEPAGEAPAYMKGLKPMSLAARISLAPPPQVGRLADQPFGVGDVNPMPSLQGSPGLFRAIGAGGLPKGSFGGTGFWDRYGRNPGGLSIDTWGTSGFVSFHERFNLDWIINVQRKIKVRRADQLSFGQDRLTRLNFGGCDFLNCSPDNLLPRVNFDQEAIRLLRNPGTGALLSFTGFYPEFPFANRSRQNGVGEIQIGGRISLLNFSDDSPVAIAFRPRVTIPTAQAPGNFWQTAQTGNPLTTADKERMFVQDTSWHVGFDLLLEAHAGNLLGFYGNIGYTHVSDPENGDNNILNTFDIVPLRIGINIPRTSRVQLLVEYTADWFVRESTPMPFTNVATDGTVGLRLFPYPWLSFTAAYRHTLNHSQYGGGDKHGFVFMIGASHIPIEPIAPVPPTVTCLAEPRVVKPGEPVTLTATATSPSGGALTYTWSTTGGRIEGTGPAARLDTTGLAPGTYTTTVRVDDGMGGFADCTTTVTVEAPPPPPPPKAPVATCSADKTTVAPGEVVNVQATASSPDNRPLNYDWTVTGGRITGSGPSVRWDTTNLAPGSYTATARVTDDRGLSAECSVTINVQAPPAPKISRLNECSFRRSSVRVDNVCKAVLDDVALRLQNEPEARAVVIGSQSARDRGRDIGARRASNVKAYLVRDKGIAADRIEVRTSTEDAMRVEIWLVPRGSNAADVPGSAAQEQMPPAPRRR